MALSLVLLDFFLMLICSASVNTGAARNVDTYMLNSNMTWSAANITCSLLGINATGDIDVYPYHVNFDLVQKEAWIGAHMEYYPGQESKMNQHKVWGSPESTKNTCVSVKQGDGQTLTVQPRMCNSTLSAALCMGHASTVTSIPNNYMKTSKVVNIDTTVPNMHKTKNTPDLGSVKATLETINAVLNVTRIYTTSAFSYNSTDMTPNISSQLFNMTTDTREKSTHSNRIYVIIGCSLGGMTILIVFVVIIVFIYRKKTLDPDQKSGNLRCNQTYGDVELNSLPQRDIGSSVSDKYYTEQNTKNINTPKNKKDVQKSDPVPTRNPYEKQEEHNIDREYDNMIPHMNVYKHRKSREDGNNSPQDLAYDPNDSYDHLKPRLRQNNTLQDSTYDVSPLNDVYNHLESRVRLNQTPQYSEYDISPDNNLYHHLESRIDRNNTPQEYEYDVSPLNDIYNHLESKVNMKNEPHDDSGYGLYNYQGNGSRMEVNADDSEQNINVHINDEQGFRTYDHLEDKSKKSRKDEYKSSVYCHTNLPDQKYEDNEYDHLAHKVIVENAGLYDHI